MTNYDYTQEEVDEMHANLGLAILVVKGALKQASQEEVMSYAWQLLTFCWRRFDPAKAKLSSFLNGSVMHICNAYQVDNSTVKISAAMRQKIRKSEKVYSINSLDAPDLNGVDNINSHEMTFDDHWDDYDANDMFKILGCLEKKHEYIYVSYHRDGRTMLDISRVIGVTPQRIQQILLSSQIKIRNKIKENSIEPYKIKENQYNG